MHKSTQSKTEGKTCGKAKLQRIGEKFKITSESPSREQERYKKVFKNSRTNIRVCVCVCACLYIYYIYIYYIDL